MGGVYAPSPRPDKQNSTVQPAEGLVSSIQLPLTRRDGGSHSIHVTETTFSEREKRGRETRKAAQKAKYKVHAAAQTANRQ